MTRLTWAEQGSFLSEPVPGSGWFRLVSEDGMVCDGVDGIDISQSDLLHFTNAGDDVAYAIFLVDLAASFGALRVYVTHNEWYSKLVSLCVSCIQVVRGLSVLCTRQDPNLGRFRGVPLVDTEALLTDALLTSFFEPHEEGCIEHTVSLGEVPQLNEPTLTIALKPARHEGAPVTCPDFVLSSDKVEVSRGYLVSVSDRDEQDLMHFIFRSSDSGKRAGGHQRIDFRSRARVGE